MAALVQAAGSGRGGARGGLLARAAWRLLLLLGLACAAAVLLGATSSADAADCGTAGCDQPAPARHPGLLPGLVKTADAILHPILRPSTVESTPVPASGSSTSSSASGTTAAPTTSTTSTTSLSSAAAAAGEQAAVTATPEPASAPSKPAGHVAPVAALLGSLSAPADDATHSNATGATAALPSLHDAVAPVLDTAAHAVTGVVDGLADTTSPLPVVGLVTKLVRSAATTVSSAVVSSVDSLTTRVDAHLSDVTAGVTGLTAGLGALLAPSYAGGQRLPGTAGASAGSIAPGAAGSSAQAPAQLPGSFVLSPRDGLRQAAAAADLLHAGSAPGVRPAPPESGATAVQSAPVAVAAPAAPVPGAVGTAQGSTPGSAPSGSTGSHGQTEAPRAFAFRGVMVIGGPAVTVVGPLPGTPLVDPGFSPD